MSETSQPTVVEVHNLRSDHLDDVIRVDALRSGERKPHYWAGVFQSFLDTHDSDGRVGLAAESEGRFIGYLLGEIRAFEFGSEPCGWIFAVGVDPDHSRAGVASALLEHACSSFRRMGVAGVRTMVRRDEVAVLSFFRANGFEGGSFVQLEKELGGQI
jgi:ribosomal protein S18 acetylase RimI-like enzyme